MTLHYASLLKCVIVFHAHNTSTKPAQCVADVWMDMLLLSTPIAWLVWNVKTTSTTG